MDLQTFLTSVDITTGNVTQTIPAAPTTLVATADSDSIGLTWTRVGTYDNVLIDRKSTGEYSQLTSIPTAASYDDTTAVPGVTYTYRVRGQRNGLPSPYSNESSDTVSTLFAASSDGTASNYLDGSDPASLQVNPATDSFIIAGWVKPTTLVLDYQTLMTNGDFGDGIQYWGMAIEAGGSVIMSTMISAIADDRVISDEILSDGTKAFVIGWFDATQSKLFVQVDANAAKSKAVTIGSPSPVGGVRAFSDSSGGDIYGFHGVLDEWFFCKNPASLANALTLINSTIYNSGNGTHYSALSAGNKTTLGLVSWWGFDEAASAARKDLHGTNDLTKHGTITQVTALTV